jgi:hypothetical protein
MTELLRRRGTCEATRRDAAPPPLRNEKRGYRAAPPLLCRCFNSGIRHKRGRRANADPAADDFRGWVGARIAPDARITGRPSFPASAGKRGTGGWGSDQPLRTTTVLLFVLRMPRRRWCGGPRLTVARGSPLVRQWSCTCLICSTVTAPRPYHLQTRLRKVPRKSPP